MRSLAFKAPRPGEPSPSAEDPAQLGFELKYAFDRWSLGVVESHLAAACRRDPEHPSNTVVSVYFDTPDLVLLRQKADSLYLKTKLRLRWYRSPGAPPSQAFWELKRRVGNRRSKRRWPTTLEGAAIERRSFAALASLPMPPDLLAEELPWPLLPILQVAYRRRRYVDPHGGVRMSCDSAITAERGHPLLGRSRRGVLAGGVVEAKGSRAVAPPCLQGLFGRLCFRSSFSKYDACYRSLT
ncbi:MAG: VTC domain-containing protein [Acidobacteriota bacterium]